MKSIDKSIEILVEKVKLALREYNEKTAQKESEKGREKTTTDTDTRVEM